MRKKISIDKAEHYNWGGNCDGWHLAKNEILSVIQERVPPGSSETSHFHEISRQFFYILEGEGTIEFKGEAVKLLKNEGIEIPPGTAHKFRNNSAEDVTFLVISSPHSHGDRTSTE